MKEQQKSKPKHKFNLNKIQKEIFILNQFETKKLTFENEFMFFAQINTTPIHKTQKETKYIINTLLKGIFSFFKQNYLEIFFFSNL